VTGRGPLDDWTDVAPARTPLREAEPDVAARNGYLDDRYPAGLDRDPDDLDDLDDLAGQDDLDVDPDDLDPDGGRFDDAHDDDPADEFVDDHDDHDDLADEFADDPVDGVDRRHHPDDLLDELDERDRPTARPAQAWAGVVAQWLAGAVAGAVLWVLFRYLWRGLPVVALAAALLVTAGLVLLVRQLLHDVDRRTTGFAVLVGLLLTASPAVLVLLGR
jgi:hypothetical protein